MGLGLGVVLVSPPTASMVTCSVPLDHTPGTPTCHGPHMPLCPGRTLTLSRTLGRCDGGFSIKAPIHNPLTLPLAPIPFMHSRMGHISALRETTHHNPDPDADGLIIAFEQWANRNLLPNPSPHPKADPGYWAIGHAPSLTTEIPSAYHFCPNKSSPALPNPNLAMTLGMGIISEQCACYRDHEQCRGYGCGMTPAQICLKVPWLRVWHDPSPDIPE